MTSRCAPASARSVAGGPGLPDVLADRRPDERVAEAQQQELASLGEVAVLVEDAVVGEELLAVHAHDLAAGADGAGVREVGVQPRAADERDDVGAGGRDLLERAAGRPHEARPQQQVLGRVAGHRELGQDDEIGRRRPRVLDARDDPVAVAGEVADDDVDLRQR